MSLDVTLERDACRHCGRGPDDVLSLNITHNLNRMAQEANIYGPLWRPEENGIATAGQLILPLQEAIIEMRRDPARFKRFDAENGWGTYEDFLPWLEELLVSCQEHPDCRVRADR